jgi:hypothetical protein
MAGGHVCLFTLDGRPLIGKGSFEMVETITPLPDEWLDRGMLPPHRRPKVFVCLNIFEWLLPGSGVLRGRGEAGGPEGPLME